MEITYLKTSNLSISGYAKWFLILVLVAAATLGWGQTASLTGLGAGFTATALSRNGLVAVGYDSTDAAYWSHGTITHLGIGAGAEANSCNADGTVIVGKTNDDFPFIWSGGTFYKLNSFGNKGEADLISANGAKILGILGSTPVAWAVFTLSETALLKQLPVDGGSTVIPTAISDDGSTIAVEEQTSGGSYSLFTANLNQDGTLKTEVPALYRSYNELTYSASVPPVYNPFSEQPYSAILCLTADGSQGFGGWYDLYSTVETAGQAPGSSYFNPFSDAFKGVAFNNSSTTAINGGSDSSEGLGMEIDSCSSSGQILAGTDRALNYTNDSHGNLYAYFTPEETAISLDGNFAVNFTQLLTEKGANTAGWTLSSIGTQSMSADGSIILGSGTDPNNQPENWIATLLPQLSNLSATRSTVIGGALDQVTASLDYPAPTTSEIQVASSNTAVIPNFSCSLLSGTMTANSNVQTSPVSVKTSVTLTATYNSTSMQTVITVNPALIQDMYVAPSIIVGGQSTHGVVQLAGPAGPSGDVVALSSSSSDVSVPASATVAANGTGASFLITSVAVSAPENVNIKATLNGAGHQWTLVVNPAPLTAFYPSPGIITGGDTTAGYVTIGGSAGASGDLISLSSNNTAVTLQNSVTISSGSENASVSIHASPVSTQTVVLLTATFGGSSITSQLVVSPAALSNFFVSPTSVAGGASASGVVQLNAPAASADAVTLSSNSSAVTVPSSVTVAGGKSGISFTTQTAPVSVTTAAVLTATLGSVSRQIVLTVNTPVMSNFYLSPASIKGGTTTHGVIQLAGNAGPNGAIVSLSTSDSHATVPQLVVIPAGSTGASFAVASKVVTASTNLTIFASYGEGVKKATLTLTP